MTDGADRAAAVRDGVTVVMPVRDEAASVVEALASVAEQTVGREALEVLVYDGMSGDGTKQLAQAFGERLDWRRFEVLDNHSRTVPQALNMALAASRSQWFVRVDGRTRLAANYLEACVHRARSQGPSTAVGGRFVAEATERVPQAVAAAVTHRVGVGQGFRTARGPLVSVPHHPFAVWHTEQVRRLGGFNEDLVRNQDDEFSMRAVRDGASIQLTDETTVTYRPRERLRGLAAQYFQYGLWKAAVGRRQGLFPARSLAPTVASVGIAVAAAAGAAGGWRRPALVVGALYAGLGALASRKREGANLILTGTALCVVHTSYGFGVLAGAVHPGLAETALGRGRLR